MLLDPFEFQTSGGGGATFVTEHHYSAHTSQAVSFSGASAGDLAVVILSNSLTALPSAPAGWTAGTSYTWATYGYHEQIYYKVLSSGDISTGSVTFTGLDSADALISALFYSGASVATVVSTVDVGTVAVNIPGFTKNVASKGIVAYCTNRTTGAITAPPGFTTRVATYSSPNFSTIATDIASLSYADGTSVNFTPASVGFEAIGRLIELT